MSCGYCHGTGVVPDYPGATTMRACGCRATQAGAAGPISKAVMAMHKVFTPEQQKDLEEYIKGGKIEPYPIWSPPTGRERSPPFVPQMTIEDHATRMLFDRIATVGNTITLRPDEFLLTKVIDEMVYLIFILGKTEGIIKCERALFPSDETVTQIRLLLEANRK